MRLCNHYAKLVFFTAKLSAMNGDKCKCSNGLTQDFEGLRVEVRSENECTQILRFTIVRCLPPVTFTSTKLQAATVFLGESPLAQRTAPLRLSMSVSPTPSHLD
jgi:hypothetical protein